MNFFMKNFNDKIKEVLKSEIGEIETALSSSYENMQLVKEEGLLDFYAYLIKAYEAKHRFLLKKLKESS